MLLLCLSLLWLGSGFVSTEPRDWLGRTCPCGTWFSCSYFYSVRGLVWSDWVVDLIDAHFLRQSDELFCACSSGFFLRNNHNCTEFLALPFSPFLSFCISLYPLPSPPLPLFPFPSFPPRLLLPLPFLLPFHCLRNDLYCVEWGVKPYSNQPILPFPKRWCTWTSEYDQRWRRSRTIAYSMRLFTVHAWLKSECILLSAFCYRRSY